MANDDDKPSAPLVLPFERPKIVEPGSLIINPNDGSNALSHSDIKMYLDGLIVRDCEAPDPATLKKWRESPEGIEQARKDEERRQRFERGELRMITVAERRKDGSSLKYIEVDRPAARKLIAETKEAGATFNPDFVAWANEDA